MKKMFLIMLVTFTIFSLSSFKEGNFKNEFVSYYWFQVDENADYTATEPILAEDVAFIQWSNQTPFGSGCLLGGNYSCVAGFTAEQIYINEFDQYQLIDDNQVPAIIGRTRP